MNAMTLMNQLVLNNFDEASWEPFRSGVDILPLHGQPTKAGASALLRYQPGASVPRHFHTEVEHILVLSGSQQDEAGNYVAGQLVINPAGSSHGVSSPNGCIVLAVWSGDLELLPED